MSNNNKTQKNSKDNRVTKAVWITIGAAVAVGAVFYLGFQVGSTNEMNTNNRIQEAVSAKVESLKK